VVRGRQLSDQRQLLASGAEPTARSECGDASPLSTLNAQRFNEEGFVVRWSLHQPSNFNHQTSV